MNGKPEKHAIPFQQSWKLKLLAMVVMLFFAILIAGYGNPVALVLFPVFPQGLVLLLGWTPLGQSCLQSTTNPGCESFLIQVTVVGWVVYLGLGAGVVLSQKRWLVILLLIIFLGLLIITTSGCHAILGNQLHGGDL